MRRRAVPAALVATLVTLSTGCADGNDGPSNGAKLKTMVESGNITWDVIDQS